MSMINPWDHLPPTKSDMKETDYEAAKSNFMESQNILSQINSLELIIEGNNDAIKQIESVAKTYLNFEPIRNSARARKWLILGIEEENRRAQKQIEKLKERFSELMGNPTESS